VPSLSLDGYEADDVIGTLALRAKKLGWEVVIVTGDRDALQLVQPGITVMAFKKGVTETMRYDEAAVMKEYGLTPAQFLEYKVMRGDPSDNIPGIKGIGEKGATELLQTYGTLKGIYAAAHDASSNLAKGLREKLLSAEAEIPSITELVTIFTEVPVEYLPEPTVFPSDRDGFLSFLRTQGFKTLLQKFSGEALQQKTEPIKRVASSKKSRPPQGDLSSILLKQISVTQDEMPTVIEKLIEKKGIVVRVQRSKQQDLFGDESGGLFLADDHTVYYFAASVVQKNKKILGDFFCK